MSNVRSCLVWLVATGLFGACDGNHILGVETNPDAQAPSGAGGTKGGLSSNAACSSLESTGAGGWGGPDRNANTGSTSAVPPPPGSLGPVQRWTGYVERRTFPSGSESIKLSLASDSAGNVAGTVVFGQGTPLPPATDPNVGYPPDPADWTKTWPAEGYVYQMNTAKITAQHLTFHVSLRQFFSSWCALQTPVAPGAISCAPNGTFIEKNGGCTFRSSPACGSELLNCDKVTMCKSFCYCPGPTCEALLDLGPNQPLNDMFVDLFLTGDTANGTAWGEVGGAAHFTKDAPADGGI